VPLRVAFNATPLLRPLTGIGNYIVHLGAELAAMGGVDLWSFYSFHWRHEAPTPPADGGAGQIVISRARDLVKPTFPYRRELRDAAQRVLFGRGARRNGIELYHEPNFVPIRSDIPFVVTIHDLSWLRYPETHPPDRVRWLQRAIERTLREARAVLVVSDFVRQELLAEFAVPPDLVHTTHLGVSAMFRPHSAAQTLDTLRDFGLAHGSYVLTVGTIEPRKNVRHLLAAFGALPVALRERFPLVIAGARGWRDADLMADLRLLAQRGQIRFVGHVPQNALPALYAGAALFVFPSVYEGFGLPPLEAMASGVPVIASNRASIPEVVGDAAQLIDPEQPQDTAGRMEALLNDVQARSELARLGRARAGAFTWRACAEATLRVYQGACGRRG
jgi:glycosyltransferase involved in cell wall biosynthesis